MAIIPLIDHAAPMRGSAVSTPSTRTRPHVGDELAGGRLRAAPTSTGDTTAPPQSAHDGDPQAAELVEVRAEAGLPALDARRG